MKYGMNLLLWGGEINDDLLPTLESLKKMGYDGVEVPMFNLDLDYASWGKKLDDLGLERTAVTVRNLKTIRSVPMQAFEPRELSSIRRRSIAVRP